MKTIISTRHFLMIACFAVLIACQKPVGNQTGSEFMPDMAHSIAYEANYSNYYYNNTWSSEEEYEDFATPRSPVAGTIPHTGGSSTYAYGNSEDERTRAIAELISNPYPITAAGLAQGKELYDIFCAICHGPKGGGMGYLVRDDGGVYPVQPANFLLDEHLNASNGRYYHAIMYGKNLMGSYKDKMNEEERWQIIHYIRSLQAKEKKLVYSADENTLNASFGTPIANVEIHDVHHNGDASPGHDDGHHHDGHNGSHDHDNHMDMNDGHHDDGSHDHHDEDQGEH
jgi:mono/diheme cytochrome c family protein